MDISALASLISAVGFPIVAVLGCAFFICKMTVANREDCNNRIKAIEAAAEKREDKLYQQMQGFNDSLCRFNETLTRIDTRLEIVEKEIDH